MEEVEEEGEGVLEAGDQWQWEVFSKEECQNYGQLEVKKKKKRQIFSEQQQIDAAMVCFLV